MNQQRLGLPEANEFSPGQIGLRRVLEIVQHSAGDRAAITEEIRQEYFAESAARQTTSEKRRAVQRTRASNVLIGMKAYGLFDPSTAGPTQLGLDILAEPDDGTQWLKLATHILTNLHGREVLEAWTDLQDRGIQPTKRNLARELTVRGFSLPRATTHHTKLVQWLRSAGLFDGEKVNQDVLRGLLGVGTDDLRQIAGMTSEQRSLARTLRRVVLISGENKVTARNLVDQAVLEFGPIFQEDQLRAQVFRPLEDMGYVKLGGVGAGRGGKSGTIEATKKLLELREEFLTNVESGIPPELRPRLNTPLDQILSDLKSTDKHVKGIALELLALRMVLDLTLMPRKFRERSDATGQAEVDLIAEAAHLHFSRWTFQCKNTSTVSVADLAKEAGLALMMRTQVIVMVTTGRFAGTVVDHVRLLAESSPIQAVLVDGPMLDRYKRGGQRELLAMFRQRAEETLQMKRGQVP